MMMKIDEGLGQTCEEGSWITNRERLLSMQDGQSDIKLKENKINREEIQTLTPKYLSPFRENSKKNHSSLPSYFMANSRYPIHKKVPYLKDFVGKFYPSDEIRSLSQDVDKRVNTEVCHICPGRASMVFMRPSLQGKKRERNQDNDKDQKSYKPASKPSPRRQII